MNITRIKPTAWIFFLCAAVVVATCTLFSQGSTTSASPAPLASTVADTGGALNMTPASKIQKTATDFTKTWKPLQGSSSSKWVSSFLAAPPTLASNGAIDTETAQAYTNGQQVLVRAAVTGKNLVEPSGVSALLDIKTGQKSTSVETVFVQGKGGGSVKTWIDGKNVLNTFVPDPTKSGSTQTVGWNEFTACLNGAGVAAWVVTAITVACSAICVGTAGAGCIPCITAAAGVTGGVFYSCAAQALFYS